MSRIRIDGLTRRFGTVTAVDQVSLEIEHGGFLVLLGPSGCGKSTLLRMIAGLIPPHAGRILLDDTDITHTPPRERDLAMVFQNYALYPHLTVERNIGFPLRARRRSQAEIRRKVDEVARVLDLTDLLRRRPRELSGGQRQRVALGRALVRDPGAFLMDEPLSNLDARLRTATRAELTELHRTLGSTFVYVTHDQVEAMTMATRIALLNHGRVEQAGAPSEVYDTPDSVFVAGFLGSPPMNLLPAQIHGRGGRLRAVARDVDVPLGIAGDTAPRDVVLGVRPEHLVRVPPAEVNHETADQAAMMRGTVRIVENLGGEEVAHCLVGETTVCVRGRRPLGLSVGDAVAFQAGPGHIHLFDRTSGRRLVWRDEPKLDGRLPPAPVSRTPDSLPDLDVSTV